MKTKLFLLITFFTLLINYAQITYVPDDNFEQALIDLGYDSGTLDDYVPTANISSITNLSIANKNISDLTGIEDFTNLSNLLCWNNNLSQLDLSMNLALTGLKCNGNQLTSLDLSNNTLLNYLKCYYNELTSLDISQNTNLNFLRCEGNLLVNLNVKNGNNLNFTNFNTTNNPGLLCIEVDDPVWSTSNWIDIDATASFSEDCHYSSTYIPDDNFEQALIDLGFDSGVLNDYVPTVNINSITVLNVDNMDISDLTGIEAFTALEELFLRNNQLTTINLENNLQLRKLNFFNNQILSIDLNANINLNELITVQNPLTELDLTQNVNLTKVNCINNDLTVLNIKNGNNNAITNLSFNTSTNPDLTCIIVDNAAWSTANWTYIDSNSTFVNSMAACNTLSTVNDKFESSIKLYPNPVKNRIIIENNSNLKIDSISIYSILGKKVFQSNHIENSIDVSQLLNGFYYIKIASNNQYFTQKIIINK